MKLEKYIIPLFFLLLYYFPIFLHLDSLSLQLYDEARRAVNAAEMLEKGNLIVTHYGGKADMWGTKPPLLIWAQAFFLKLVGYNELAIRLPSALAALGTIFMIVVFCAKVLKEKLLGYLAGLVLLTTFGYVVGAHTIRRGDFDAMLALWTTGYLTSFFAYLVTEGKKQKTQLFYLTCLFVILGALTKGIAAFFFLPGLFIYAVYSKNLGMIIRSKHTYIGLFTIIFFVVGFYLLRDYLNPGYLESVWKNELGGRYMDTLESHQHSFFYYFTNLFNVRSPYWIWFLPLSLITIFLQDKNVKNFGFYLFFNILLYLLIISNSSTKLAWYDFQIFPALSIIVAIGLNALLKAGAQSIKHLKKGWYFAFVLFFLFSFFGQPYSSVIKKIYWPKAKNQETQYGSFLKKLDSSLDTFNIAHLNYNPHALFHVKAQEKLGKTVFTFNPHSKMAIGSKAILCEKKSKNAFEKNHKYTVLQQHKSCVLIEVLAYKVE